MATFLAAGFSFSLRHATILWHVCMIGQALRVFDGCYRAVCGRVVSLLGTIHDFSGESLPCLMWS
jgi:hypothetical protein